MAKTMKAVQLKMPKAPFELVERPIPNRGASEIRIKVAPLLCAGITTFNPLRNANARPGDLVAVQGLGGLGHLAVRFAS